MTTEELPTADELRAALADMGLSPAAQLVALREFQEQMDWRATYPTPGALAKAISPGTVQTPAMELIDQALLDLDEGRGPRRLLITMPPQEGKSQRVSRHGVTWLLKRKPHRRVAIASYERNTARRWGREIRNGILEHPHVTRLAVRQDTRAADEWRLEGYDGGVFCTGIGGALTGRPVDVLVIDDPVKGVEQADSVTYRERAWDWWTHVAETRLAPGAVVILVLTRWHEDDLAGRILLADQARPEEQREWRVLHIPAQAQEGVPDALGRKPNEYLISTRGWTEADWRLKEKRVGARAWAALYQGMPSPLEGGVFKWDWIRPYRVKEAPPLERVVVAVDTTGGGDDEAGIVVAGRDRNRHVYVIADHSGRMSVAQMWRRAWLAVLDHEADVLVYENNLVEPIMRPAIRAAWTRMRQQVQALRRHHWDVEAAAAALTRTPSWQEEGEETSESMVGQLTGLLPYGEAILAAPMSLPARVEGVRATRGKFTRAEPTAQDYETGQIHHVGYLPLLEAQMVAWQPGQTDSPDRVDALVWACTFLQVHSPASAHLTLVKMPTGADTAIGAERSRAPGQIPTGASIATLR